MLVHQWRNWFLKEISCLHFWVEIPLSFTDGELRGDWWDLVHLFNIKDQTHTQLLSRVLDLIMDQKSYGTIWR